MKSFGLFLVLLVVVICISSTVFMNGVNAAAVLPIAFPQLVTVQPGSNALIRLRGYDKNVPNVSRLSFY
jgi:uncharacterized membrane protein YfhO